MIHDTCISNAAMIAEQYVAFTPVEDSGLPYDTVADACGKIIRDTNLHPWMRTAQIFDAVLRHSRVEILPFCPFGARLDKGSIFADLRREQDKQHRSVVGAQLEKTNLHDKRKLLNANADYSHICPDWQRIFDLGIPGILAELNDRRSDPSLDEEQKIILDSCITVYEAMIAYMLRCSYAFETHGEGTELSRLAANSLRSLAEKPPRTTHEAMELIWLYYYLMCGLELTSVRSLGALDTLLMPFWQADLAAGWREEELEELLRYFFLTFRAFLHKNNIPFYLCGTDENGAPVFNELSLHILQIYDAMNISDPKIQIRWHPRLPDALTEQVLDMIRRGNNSIVILNDAVVIDALEKLGISHADAVKWAPVGCYEPSALDEVARTTAGKINLAKVAELAVHNGADGITGEQLLKRHGPAEDFEAFYSRFRAMLQETAELCMNRIRICESTDAQIHPTPVFTPTSASAAEKAKCVYSGGARYNNSSICAFSLATAVDILTAVRRLIYEDKTVTEEELSRILRDNWAGYESLRLYCARDLPKYGNGDAACDALSARIVADISDCLNGKPNGRGGVFRLGMFSINWYVDFGKGTGATPDGRFHGDVISKNLSPVIAGDKSGVTALIRSVTATDHTLIPNGAVLDLMLHASAVSGEDGMAAMKGLLRTFMRRGGIGMQINVLSPADLRRAQENPAAYANLQVRLCGWNVHFVDLSREMQDEFIRMAEHTAG